MSTIYRRCFADCTEGCVSFSPYFEASHLMNQPTNESAKRWLAVEFNFSNRNQPNEKREKKSQKNRGKNCQHWRNISAHDPKWSYRKWSLAWNQLSQYLIFEIRNHFAFQILCTELISPQKPNGAHTARVRAKARESGHIKINDKTILAKAKMLLLKSLGYTHRASGCETAHILCNVHMHPIVMAWASGRCKQWWRTDAILRFFSFAFVIVFPFFLSML